MIRLVTRWGLGQLLAIFRSWVYAIMIYDLAGSPVGTGGYLEPPYSTVHSLGSHSCFVYLTLWRPHEKKKFPTVQ
jgi:hypothetical protein